MKRPLCFLVAAFSASLFCAGAAFAQDKPATPASAAVQPDKKDEPKKDEPKKDEPKSEPVKPATPPEEKKVPDHAYVKMSTSKGDIIIKLDGKNAPISTENFLKYVDEKFYDGTIFHRVIDGFMIQGGGFKPDMSQKPTKAPIKNEWKNGLKNKKGTIAMARTQVADSATSQFFINVKDNDMLDVARDGAAYAVFGEVAAGMDVVDKIRTVKTGNKGMHGDVPVETITINSVTKLTDEEAKKAGAK